jgi:cell wall-associated NlpC family hydrolase
MIAWQHPLLLAEPRRMPRLFRTVVPLGSRPVISWLLVLSVSGCLATAPRFRAPEHKAPASGADKSGAGSNAPSRYASGEEKETKADGAEKVLSGERTFRTEKNSAISNLDEAKMMREISKMMGVSYKLGGEDQEGIDCSAYTMLVYRNALGKQLPRSSAEQFKIGAPVNYEDLKFGDLVFFNTTGEPGSHVGIYLGDDLFAHASVTLGVTISSLESSYYKKRFEGARRVVQ